MAQFSGKHMDISHLQWLYRNFTLHHRTKEYLRQWTVAPIQQEVNILSHASNLDIPRNSRYLQELPSCPPDSTSLTHDAYWILAMQAAKQSILWDKWQLAPLRRDTRHYRHHLLTNLLEGVQECLQWWLAPKQTSSSWWRRQEYTLPQPAQCRQVERLSPFVVPPFVRDDIFFFGQSTDSNITEPQTQTDGGLQDRWGKQSMEKLEHGTGMRASRLEAPESSRAGRAPLQQQTGWDKRGAGGSGLRQGGPSRMFGKGADNIQQVPIQTDRYQREWDNSFATLGENATVLSCMAM